MYKIKFLGGAQEVGRLGIIIEEHGKKVLIDYGVIPEKPPLYPLPHISSFYFINIGKGFPEVLIRS